jgi:hypothetical protein
MVEIVKYSNQILKSTLITLSVWVFKAKIKKKKKRNYISMFPCLFIYLFMGFLCSIHVSRDSQLLFHAPSSRAASSKHTCAAC